MVRQSPGVQAIAVVTGSFLSGAMMSLSLMAIPVFLDTTTQPSQLFHQWVRMYHYGHQVLPTMAVATFLLYAYAAISKGAAKNPWAVFVVAGATTVSMLPFTWIFMVPTNEILFRLEGESKAALVASLDEAQELVKTWSWLHLVRSLFPLAGALLGLTGTLQDL
ncbi:Anthrone oxygenase AgnL2 [Trapelia coarctata]|nr:Anthrone oxygenase AgnL2 [Trapelia coarctata]